MNKYNESIQSEWSIQNVKQEKSNLPLGSLC